MMPGAGATFPGPLGALGPPFAFCVLPLGFWPVSLPLRLGGFAPLGDCLRCSTTLGASGGGAGRSAADGFEGWPIGTVVLLAGAVVVVVGAVVVVVGAVVVVVGAVVVVVLGGCSALLWPGWPAPLASGTPAACPDP